MSGDSHYTQNNEGWKPSPNEAQARSGQGPVFSQSHNPQQAQRPPSPPQTPDNAENNDYHTPTEFFSDETQASLPLNFSTPAWASQLVQPSYQTPGTPVASQPTQYQQNQPDQQPLYDHAREDTARIARYSNMDPVPPGPLHSKIATLWKRDTAYKILFVTIGLVLICSLGGILLVVSTFGHSGHAGQQTNSNVSSASTSNTPTIPTPDPNKQLQATMLAATPTSMPIPTSPPLTPTPTLNNGPLSVQINNLPGSVNNHSTVPVAVTTNYSNVTVHLVVSYDGAQPTSYDSGSQSVDANGNTTFYWNIDERHFQSSRNGVTAKVMVVAQDQNGNVKNSSLETVQINTNN